MSNVNWLGSLNPLRAAGDLLHIASICLLIWKLNKTRSCVGISCKMQEMYLITFLSRYLNLFSERQHVVYSTVMKVVYIVSTSYLIYLMRKKVPTCRTYDKEADSFNYLLCLPPCVILALLTTASEKRSDPIQILWTFSIWFESVAILPQLLLLQKLRDVENLTGRYVVAMGLYRLCYIFNWIYRYYTDGFQNLVGWAAGVVQTALYLDFFYYYAQSKWYGKKMQLPVMGQDV